MREKTEFYAPEGCTHLYKISNLGEVYSVKLNRKVGSTNDRGYRYFTTSVNGVRKQIYLARLIMQLFGSAPEKYSKHVIYKDGDRSNCHISNLSWATAEHYEKLQKKRWALHPDMCKTNTGRTNNHNSHLTDDQVREIRKLDGTVYEISLQLGLREHVIRGIKKGKTFKWIV